MNKTHSPG